MKRFMDPIDEALGWLKADYGISLPEGSPLGYIYGITCQERTRCRGQGAEASGALTQPELRALCGFARIAARLNRAHTAKGIPPSFVKHIRLLDVGIPSQASRYDDVPSASGNRETVRQASDVLFELSVALAALDVSDSVEIERIGGSNKPDVCMAAGPERWGLGCKVCNSEKPLRHFGIARHGVERAIAHIERGGADRGCVVLCVQNAFPRYALQYASEDEVNGSLDRRADDFSRQVQEHVRDEAILQSLFEDPRMEPGIVIYFEEVFHIVAERASPILRPTSGRWQSRPGRINYSPVAYAKYITFGVYGRSASPVIGRLMRALAWPVSPT